MRLTVRNIGKIKDTVIEFSNLTIISGENDVGKSTIGKLLLLLFKHLIHFQTLTIRNLHPSKMISYNGYIFKYADILNSMKIRS
ncbi:AAA family ATPase [Acinetobacter johnsonii]|uniref:AAA family ATPase n=1 Tax=Acinetobacter johnsonii TaxID=40214 RepID=UPI003C7BF43D